MSKQLTHKELLQNHVQEAIRQYFVALDGANANNIYNLMIDQIEQPLIAAVMHHAKQNQSLAAKWLGISRNTLRKLIEKHNL